MPSSKALLQQALVPGGALGSCIRTADPSEQKPNTRTEERKFTSSGPPDLSFK